jgi:hypothetical protein
MTSVFGGFQLSMSQSHSRFTALGSTNIPWAGEHGRTVRLPLNGIGFLAVRKELNLLPFVFENIRTHFWFQAKPPENIHEQL